MGVIPRVYLHDATLKRIAQLGTASSVNRSFELGGPGNADVSVSPNEPFILDCNPQLGRVLVIESDSYPFPWVGKVTIARRDRTAGAVVIQAKGFDGILDQRLLGERIAVASTCDKAFRQVLGEVNGTDSTGIEPGAIAGGPYIEAVFSRQSGTAALNEIAQRAGMEWWLEYAVSNSGIGIRANLASWRGFDRFNQVTLADPGTCTYDSWIVDGEAFTFSLTTLGGASSPVASVTERATGSATLSLTSLRGPLGYSVDGIPGQSPALTRADRLIVSDTLRDNGLARDAAEVALARQDGINGVPRQIAVSVPTNAAVWAKLDVGSVVHLSAPDAFFAGFNGPARIRGVQPMEEDGKADVVLQLLRARL
jgi:hypothetical protein